jgi:hypothetical protein
MHMSQSLFYLTTDLNVSGVTITHLQEHKTTVTTASGNRYTVIDRFKFNKAPTSHSNQFKLFHDNNRQQYGYVHYSLFK